VLGLVLRSFHETRPSTAWPVGKMYVLAASAKNKGYALQFLQERSFSMASSIRSNSVRESRQVRLLGLRSVDTCSTCAMCFEPISAGRALGVENAGRAAFRTRDDGLVHVLYWSNGCSMSAVIRNSQARFRVPRRLPVVCRAPQRYRRSDSRQVRGRVDRRPASDRYRPDEKDWRECGA
jgi:hypothetical protein